MFAFKGKKSFPSEGFGLKDSGGHEESCSEGLPPQKVYQNVSLWGA